MTAWSDIFVGDPVLIQRIWKKDPGAYSIVVPAPGNWEGVSPVYLRAIARGAGGGGPDDSTVWGGGGAYARTKLPVAPNSTLLVQVGQVFTAEQLGDSFVKSANGTAICYAARGMGTGAGGRSSDCIGDITSSGSAGTTSGVVGAGGASASDAAYFAAVDAGSAGYDNTGSGNVCAADFGGGGRVIWTNGVTGAGKEIVWAGYNPGSGVVVLEFFDRDPLY